MINKKLLLVSANVFAVPYPVYPLGLSYIASYLSGKAPELEIRFFDFIVNGAENYINLLSEYKPDYIGISLRNVDDVNAYNRESFLQGYKTAVELSRRHSDAIITIGGSAYSIYPEYLFNLLEPDFAIYGEGEESFYQLLMSFESRTGFEQIQGLVYKKAGELQLNPRNNYFRTPELELNDDLVDFYWQNSGMLSIQTKRGCPFSCIYCTYPLIEGKKVRTLEPDRIVKSLERLYHDKGIDYYFFTDSIFNIHDEFNYRLAEKIIQSGIKIKWGAYFSPYNMNEKLLALLKESGLTHIEFGTDSISDSQLKNYRKSFTVKDVIEKSALCNKLDIYFAHFLILGGIGETDDSIDETYSNSKLIDNTAFFPFIGMRIYPGTPLHKVAIEEGIISSDDKLLEPKYYISKKFDMDSLKEKAKQTGKKWVFPDEDLTDVMMKFRKKNKKGPLWEYIIS